MTEQSLVTLTVGTARKLESAVASLTTEELEYLERCEAVIGENVRAFMAVGLALAEVQRLKLYRADYDNFEEYLNDRWDISEDYGYKLLTAAKVTTNLKQRLGDSYPLPTAVRQVRNIASLPEDIQAEAWAQACELVGGDHAPPSSVVDAVAEERRALMPAPTAPQRGRPRKVVTAQPADKGQPESKSKLSDEFFTPDHFVEAVRDVLGSIELDPASCEEANATVGALKYFTAEEDGLAQEWLAQTVFLNPPYSRELIDRFVGKLLIHYNDQRVDEAILLVNAMTSSDWFEPLFQFPCCFVKGRIKFKKSKAVLEAEAEAQAEDPDKKISSTGYYPSVFVYLGENPDKFIERFSELGTVVQAVR